MATTFCLINQKGGCGKSSTCFHLAGAFAELGQNVLLLDMDPQGSLSQGFLGPEVVESLASRQTMAKLFEETCFFEPRDELLIPTQFDRITVCPANHTLATFNVPAPEKTGMLQYAVQEFVAEQTVDFDVILIDCPPNLYRCTWTSLMAADYVLIPVPPEDFGTQGLRAVHQCVQQARQLNPSLRRLGHLVTRCDSRLLVHRMYEQKLRASYDAVLDTVIPEASAFKVALTRRRPVQFHDPRSKAAKLTLSLAREILHRINLDQCKRRVA